MGYQPEEISQEPVSEKSSPGPEGVRKAEVPVESPLVAPASPSKKRKSKNQIEAPVAEAEGIRSRIPMLCVLLKNTLPKDTKEIEAISSMFNLQSETYYDLNRHEELQARLRRVLEVAAFAFKISASDTHENKALEGFVKEFAETSYNWGRMLK
eukprot:Trichotokara_eunicae@DN6196_c0_g1_i2.p1